MTKKDSLSLALELDAQVDADAFAFNSAVGVGVAFSASIGIDENTEPNYLGDPHVIATVYGNKISDITFSPGIISDDVRVISRGLSVAVYSAFLSWKDSFSVYYHIYLTESHQKSSFDISTITCPFSQEIYYNWLNGANGDDSTV